MNVSSPANGKKLIHINHKTLYPWIIILAGLCFMFIPTFIHLYQNYWQLDDFAHSPIVLAVALWLFYKKWPEMLDASVGQKSSPYGWVILIIGLLLYLVGRSQSITLLEASSLIFLLLATGLILLGTRSVKVVWFPLFFLLFMIPLPAFISDAISIPMKTAVSYVTELLLYMMGYPIARSGVILQIGQYQLLVANACAGLNTLFTLESLGLLYLNLIRHESFARNLTLVLLIVPISFTANVIRVMVLTLITYYFGDEAGQGFLHGFAGMVLFLSALLLIIGADALARKVFDREKLVEQISR